MQTESFISGKDASLESTIRTMQTKLATRGFVLNESFWLNEIESIWSVHVKDHEGAWMYFLIGCAVNLALPSRNDIKFLPN